jgi:hypothetical protein
MRTRLAIVAAVAGALIAPASATAGGWATVGLDPLPDGVGPGKTWEVELTVLQHGRTPLENVRPRVIITRAGDRDVFPARATSEPGVYRAEVVFPSAGTWRYAVDDGFTQTHTFPPVRVREGGTAKAPATGRDNQPAVAVAQSGPSGGSGDDSGGGSDLLPAVAIAAVAALAVAFGAALLRRRRPPAAPEGG